jgi:hypothetical protein
VYFSLGDKENKAKLLTNPCMNVVLGSMRNPAIAEEAVTCLEHLIKSVKDPQEWPELYEILFGKLYEYINE